jgi:hypothetical protein
MDRASEYSCDNIISGSAKIHNERNVTKEEILDEADKVWKCCKERSVDITDLDAVEEFMSELRKQFKEFCTSYPIAMRYMAQFNSYNRKALEKYLNKIEKKPWKSESEYLESQADYVVILYKETHPKWNTTHVNNLRRNIITMLENESKVFKERLDSSEKKVNETEKRINDESKAELKSYFRRILGSQPQLPPQIQPQNDVVSLCDD